MTTCVDHLLPVAGRSALSIESGQGAYVFDSGGRRYLDAITGIGVNALGYGHPRLTAAIADQSQRCVHTSNLFHNPFQDRLADRLCEMTGLDLAFFSSTGTEAVEAALKAVRARRLGKIVALHNSFHGRTFGSLAVTGQPKYRQPFEPLSLDVAFVEPNDRWGLLQAMSGDIAGVIVEPVLGEGGILPLEAGFLQLARELATRSGALLIADEIQCGLGRTGRHFAYDAAGIRPDIVVLAKPLGGGLPLAATSVHGRSRRRVASRDARDDLRRRTIRMPGRARISGCHGRFAPEHSRGGQAIARGPAALVQTASVPFHEVACEGPHDQIEPDRPGHHLSIGPRELGLLINCTHATVLRLLPPFTLTTREANESWIPLMRY